MKYKCLIVDDDDAWQHVLSSLINRLEDLTLVGVAKDGFEAINMLNKTEVDIIFLDISMPEMDGLEVSRAVGDETAIIFVTASEEHAIEAFNLNATDYLLKPITNNRFLESVARAKMRIAHYRSNLKNAEGQKASEQGDGASMDDETFFIKESGQFFKISFDDIYYIKAAKDYVSLHTEKRNYTIHSTMKGIDEKMAKPNFIRVHRSYIVNIDKIDKIENNCVYIKDAVIKVSRTYKAALMEAINKL